MLINDWDISNAKARQARVIDNHHSLSNSSVWNTGSNRPIFQRNQLGFKTFTVELWVKGAGYQEIVNNRGLILSHLMGEVILKLDWFDHQFKAVLNKVSVTEASKQKFHVLSLEFCGYEFADMEEFPISISTDFVINNIGTAETPVILEITPQSGVIDIPYDQMRASIICDEDDLFLADDDEAVIVSYDFDSLIIDGLCYDPRTNESLPIEIRNITPGRMITIDGETGLIAEDGVVKIDDVDIWALPTIQPGENRIKTNNNWLSITVRYEPRFM